MRRLLIIAAFFVLGVAPIASPRTEAESRTILVNWNERRPVEEGYLAFRVTRIVVSSQRWSIVGQFTNRSGSTIRLPRTKPADFPSCRMSIIQLYRRNHPYRSSWGRNDFLATGFSPRLPGALRPGESWRGTFSGPGSLPSDVRLQPCFGLFTSASEPDGFGWITSHSFRL